MTIERIAIIGFGEAGGILAADLAARGPGVSIFDTLLASAPSREAMLQKAERAGVRAEESAAAAVESAQLVISAVTASSALDAARQAAPALRPGQLFVDINSVSPDTKRAVAGSIEPSQARFVEAAVMGPFPPQRLKVPMLLGGPHAEEAARLLCALGLNARSAGDRIGVASAIKMCRSIMVKGLEALAVESLFAARRYGAEEAVLASLDASYPGMGWDDRLPDYLVSRVAEHGRRRAAEMREVARTVADAGIEPLMASAIADRQDWLAAEMERQTLAYESGRPFSWRALADAIQNK